MSAPEASLMNCLYKINRRVAFLCEIAYVRALEQAPWERGHGSEPDRAQKVFEHHSRLTGLFLGRSCVQPAVGLCALSGLILGFLPCSSQHEGSFKLWLLTSASYHQIIKVENL